MPTKKTSNKPLTMADLLARKETLLASHKVGEKVEGVVIEVTNKSLLLDIGGKSEGLVIGKAFAEAKDFVRNLKVGDKVVGSILISETPDGYCVISLRNAVKDFVWKRVEEAKINKEAVSVEVKNISPAGLSVDVFGINGFVPTSQIGKDLQSKISSLGGKFIRVKVIEIDKNASRVILSEREVSEAENIKAHGVAIKKVEIGKVYDGEVVNVFDFGAFVRIKLGKGETEIDGLVHVSEISWDKIGKPSDILSEGDKVKVKAVEVRGDKVSLSIKQAQVDPWEEVSRKYKIDDKVEGKVVKSSDFGVFVSLESGIEGLIHITKIPPATKLSVGDKVNCYIESIDPKEKKISLGLVLTSKPLGYR